MAEEVQGMSVVTQKNLARKQYFGEMLFICFSPKCGAIYPVYNWVMWE